VHTVVVTAANVADITKTAELLHGQEQQVHADAGSTGVENRAEIVVLERPIDWQIARKRGSIKTMAKARRKPRSKRPRRSRPRCVRSWSILSTSSRTYFDTGKCDIAVWPRTGINSTRSSAWPT